MKKTSINLLNKRQDTRYKAFRVNKPLKSTRSMDTNYYDGTTMTVTPNKHSTLETKPERRLINYKVVTTIKHDDPSLFDSSYSETQDNCKYDTLTNSRVLNKETAQNQEVGHTEEDTVKLSIYSSFLNVDLGKTKTFSEVNKEPVYTQDEVSVVPYLLDNEDDFTFRKNSKVIPILSSYAQISPIKSRFIEKLDRSKVVSEMSFVINLNHDCNVDFSQDYSPINKQPRFGSETFVADNCPNIEEDHSTKIQVYSMTVRQNILSKIGG